MSAVLDELEHIQSINGSHTTTTPLRRTTMPSHTHVRNLGRMHPPHPRPTVSLDPRPVVIPILSSVIGFPIVAFAIICALRHRAIKLRRRDHLKKLQSGIRSVTLDLPAKDKMSFYSGGSSPEASMKDNMADKFDSTQFSFAGVSTAQTSGVPKPSILRNSLPSSRNNNHVTFVTPASTLDASHTMKVDVVLHTIATHAAESIGVVEIHKELPWINGDSPLRRIEDEPEDSPSDTSR